MFNTDRKLHLLPIAMAVFTLFFGFGCAPQNNPDEEIAAEPIQVTECTDPRPQICTMDYNPVCAQLDAGPRRTFSNGCQACSNQEVVGYFAGECPPEP